MKYCVYLTFYSGNLLPPFYIGSTSIKKISNFYHGTVVSKKYKNIWQQELKEHSNLFKTKIVSYHNTREEALEKENKLQKLLNVVKSPMYINQAIANPNGFFGKDSSGKNNPMYGKGYLLKKEKNGMYGVHRYGKENPMYGKVGKDAPCYGRTGKKHPLFGIKKENNPNFGKIWISKIDESESKFLKKDEANILLSTNKWKLGQKTRKKN